MMEPPTLIVWLDPGNPLPGLEKKWIGGGELDAMEMALLERNRKDNLDVRVRERCRTLLSAIRAESARHSGTCAADAHAQRLLLLRHKKLLDGKIVVHPPSTL